MQPAPLPIDLTLIARNSMVDNGLETDFPQDALKQAETLEEVHPQPSTTVQDLRNKLWFSVDNDDSKDLDQLTFAEKLSDGTYKIYVAIADVDSLIKKNSPIDLFAQKNTTSVYTPTRVFSMLPEKLSTNLTSLNENVDRLALVIEAVVNPNGSQGPFNIYEAVVNNKAKLAYNSVAEWLDGKLASINAIAHVPGMDEQVRLQDYIAHLLKMYRQSEGTLTLETIEPLPEIKENKIVDIKATLSNRAKNLIEEFMIVANTIAAQFLKQHHLPSLRRVVRVPKRWDRIVEIAKDKGETLPEDPSSKALDLFLIKERLLEPDTFPDLSLAIIKLLGSGEYIVEYPDDPSVGHFSLAIKDYTHSTAPNRRFPDLVTQRMLKSILEDQPSPYTSQELEAIAKQSTEKEDEATKVERKMKKSASIVLLGTRIGQIFDGIVTGAGDKGTWIRIFHPPVDGKLVQGADQVDVGDRIKVKLVNVDMVKGFIDFAKF